MNYQLLAIFTALNIVNVILSTVRSLATVKCGKLVAALANAVSFGLYTVVVVYTVCDLPLWLKVAVVAAANFIGVFIVKLVEEKARKDKLWKIEATITWDCIEDCHNALTRASIHHNYIDVGPWAIFNCYCYTKESSKKTKELLDCYHAKYFVSESKVL